MHNIQPYGFLDAALFIIFFCHWFIRHIVTIAMLALPTCTDAFESMLYAGTP